MVTLLSIECKSSCFFFEDLSFDYENTLCLLCCLYRFESLKILKFGLYSIEIDFTAIPSLVLVGEEIELKFLI